MAEEADDLFADLHNLEENYYTEGYTLGLSDGARAGRIEGRTFGLEKGFEKFFAMGVLAGKAQVLSSRLRITSSGDTADAKVQVKPLKGSERLAKHISTLEALTEHASLSTANDEDAVSEFDDRFKRAVAKMKVIDNIIGEGAGKRESGSGSGAKTAERSIEDFGVKG